MLTIKNTLLLYPTVFVPLTYCIQESENLEEILKVKRTNFLVTFLFNNLIS